MASDTHPSTLSGHNTFRCINVPRTLTSSLVVRHETNERLGSFRVGPPRNMSLRGQEHSLTTNSRTSPPHSKNSLDDYGSCIAKNILRAIVENEPSVPCLCSKPTSVSDIVVHTFLAGTRRQQHKQESDTMS